MAFTAEQIRNAWEDSLAQGFTPEQIYQGALANFGLSAAEVDAALSSTSGVNVQQMFVPQSVQTNIGQVSYDDLINQINSRYQEGKTPELAVKSALQLGIDPAIIANLPGVTPEALTAGRNLISSGAFANTATGTSADTQRAAAVGSDQYNARLAAGLDAFGFPAEEVAKLTAAGLYGPGKQYDPGTQQGSNALGSSIQDAINYINSDENKRMAEAAVTSLPITVNGKNYIVYPEGAVLFEDGFAKSFSDTGQLVNQQTLAEYNKPTYLTPIVNALKAAAIGTVLGPAGAGLLGGTAAAAAGAGLGNLASGADLQSALKSAAIGGAAAYGLGSLFPGSAVKVDDFLAADVAQLAAQGIAEEQIAQILTQEGVSSQLINAALDAQFGTSTPGSAKGLGDNTGMTPNSVQVTGQNLGALSQLSPALAAVVGSSVLPSIQVTGQALRPDLSLPEGIGAALPAAVGSGLQQVSVTGQRPAVNNNLNTATGAAVGSIVPGIQPAIPSAADRVEVTGQRVDNNQGNIAIPGAAAVGSLALPNDINKTLTQPTQPKDRINTGLISDIIKALGLFAAGSAAKGAGSGTGTGTGSVGSIPTSKPLNYDDEYYNRIQKYYNSYMPDYPRDVATPLKEWYGSGTMSSAPSGQMSQVGSFAPGSVVGGLFGDSSLMAKPASAVKASEGTQQGLNPLFYQRYINELNDPVSGPYLKASLEQLNNPEIGGRYYKQGDLNTLEGLPTGTQLSNDFSNLFPNGVNAFVPQEANVSIPNYFGYIVNDPNFNTLYDQANAAQRVFARTGTDPNQAEYNMRNYLNSLAGGMSYTGGTPRVQDNKSLLLSLDAANGRLTSGQADAIDFLVSNAENYNRLKQQLPEWKKEGSVYYDVQKPYFDQLTTAFEDYKKKLEGVDINSLSSKELFSLFPGND